jgi:hypothetical protein
MDIRAESLIQLSRQHDHWRCHVGKIDWNENAFHVFAFELRWRAALSQDRDASNSRGAGNPVCALSVADTIACITSAP